MKSYYLCSGGVFKTFPQFEYSKPFKSGYSNPFKSGYEKNDKFYIAYLEDDQYKLIEDYYNQNNPGYWIVECVPGTISVENLFIKSIKKNGLFLEIEKVIGLTNESNIAMVIYNLSQKFNCTPINLINKFV